jgi:hypothetical protein
MKRLLLCVIEWGNKTMTTEPAEESHVAEPKPEIHFGYPIFENDSSFIGTEWRHPKIDQEWGRLDPNWP